MGEKLSERVAAIEVHADQRDIRNEIADEVAALEARCAEYHRRAQQAEATAEKKWREENARLRQALEDGATVSADLLFRCDKLEKRAEHAELWAASARDELTRLGVPYTHTAEDGREVVSTGAERVRALTIRASRSGEKKP